MGVNGKKRVDPKDLEIGRRLRVHRMTAGLSQTDLGKQIGVTFQQIQKYEKGSNRIAGSRLYKIAQAVNCQPADLFGEDGARSHSAGNVMLERMVEHRDGLRMIEAFNAMPQKLRHVITGLIIELARLR